MAPTVLVVGLLDAMATSPDSGAEADPADLGEIMELMLDPELLAATTTLTAHAGQECGFDPETAAQFGGREARIDGATDDPGASPDDELVTCGPMTLHAGAAGAPCGAA